MDWPTLSKAPVFEAIIDLRVQLAPEFELKRLRELRDRIKADYPVLEETAVWPAVAEGTNPTEPPRVNGYIFRSEDQKQVVQFRRDGFSFSRLRPYESWGKLKDEGQRLWEIYQQASKPAAVLRIGTRYINQFGIPKNAASSLQDWFHLYPKIPAELGLQARGHMQVFFGKDTETSLDTVIVETLDPVQSNPAEDSFILDIHVSREGRFEIGPEIWRALDTCRDVKNRLFFGSLTDRTRARFQ